MTKHANPVAFTVPRLTKGSGGADAVPVVLAGVGALASRHAGYAIYLTAHVYRRSTATEVDPVRLIASLTV